MDERAMRAAAHCVQLEAARISSNVTLSLLLQNVAPL